MIYSRTAFALRTVEPTVTWWACVPTVSIVTATAVEFDIHTGLGIAPASGATGRASQPRRQLDDAGCSKQTDAWTQFHYATIVSSHSIHTKRDW